MTKIQKILSGILVLQIGLIGWVFLAKRNNQHPENFTAGRFKSG